MTAAPVPRPLAMPDARVAFLPAALAAASAVPSLLMAAGGVVATISVDDATKWFGFLCATGGSVLAGYQAWRLVRRKERMADVEVDAKDYKLKYERLKAETDFAIAERNETIAYLRETLKTRDEAHAAAVAALQERLKPRHGKAPKAGPPLPEANPGA